MDWRHTNKKRSSHFRIIHFNIKIKLLPRPRELFSTLLYHTGSNLLFGRFDAKVVMDESIPSAPGCDLSEDNDLVNSFHFFLSLSLFVLISGPSFSFVLFSIHSCIINSSYLHLGINISPGNWILPLMKDQQDSIKDGSPKPSTL